GPIKKSRRSGIQPVSLARGAIPRVGIAHIPHIAPNARGMESFPTPRAGVCIMPAVTFISRVALAAVALIAMASLAPAQSPAPTVTERPEIPKGKETDVKFYAADGGIVTGRDAFARMDQAGLILWVAGNQFFAMDEVIGAYRKQHPAI